MIIIGVDFHPEFQEIASVDTDTGEYQEKHLAHPEEAEQFYRALASVGQMVRVGMEASGHGRWFERLLEELRIELWRGDAEVIRAKRGRKQKTDREDARHIFKLLLKDDFPRNRSSNIPVLFLFGSSTISAEILPASRTGIQERLLAHYVLLRWTSNDRTSSYR